MTVVAVATRSGMVESEYHGHVVVVNPDASVRLTIGEPGRIFYPRSTNKLMQAATMARLGLKLPARLAALSASSHSGEGFHQAAVEEILTSAGLSVDDLDNTPALPYDEAVARQVLRSGGSPTRLAQNCSGKHAAMVATCVVNGWPVAGYLANDHPLQKAITADIASMTGEVVDRIGIDGCGAPAHAFSLFGLARAYGRARSSTDPAHGIANAMIAYPEIVGGTCRDVTLMMQNLPTILIKDGADGVMAAALADGTGIALKIGDGAAPPRVAVLLHILTLLGIDVAAAAAAAPLPVFGHGQPVGHVRCVL